MSIETPTAAERPAEHQPFVAPETVMREFTLRGLILGSVLGILFAASSVYLGLKVGLTVSASIPVAVLSITIFRWAARALRMQPSTILENNIVQTTGSAGESIAAGVAFTLPSLLLMGFDMELSRVLLVALLGGILGVLMMIPMRHGLIVKEHGKLTYPEGTACADVLIVGEQGGTSAKTVFLGFFIGFVYNVLGLLAKLWHDTASFSATFFGRLKGGSLSFEVSPAMLGVGYIIGPRTAANMMAGGSLAFLVLVPLIHHFGDGSTEVMYPASKLIKDMSPGEIRNNFILYIGAGAVATGGFISLARALPTILGAFVAGLGSMKGGTRAAPRRTEQDLSMKVVVVGAAALAAGIWLAPILEIDFLSAILIVIFGFFFVTVSSRITGEIGSSSNPISGMTVATLLITCGLFVAIERTGVSYKAMALTTAALVCVAASNGGTISQDLKTGFLVGATPRYQQLSIMVGVITSAVVIGITLLALNRGATTFEPVSPGEDARLDLSASTQTMEGPGEIEFPVVYVREDVPLEGGTLVRGKYLVDDQGKPLYLVDPGVCGTYGFRQEPVQVSTSVPVPPDALPALGLDHQEYRRVRVDAASGLVAGEYLVTASGEPRYFLRPQTKYDAPKAQLFRLIIDGSLGGVLPVGLVLIGAFLAIMMELVGVSSLPFAVGLYLPISTSAGIFVGGIMRWIVDRRTRGLSSTETEFSPGVLMASGLIAGGAIAGVLQSVLALKEWDQKLDLSGRVTGGLATLVQNDGWWPMAVFLVMALWLLRVGLRSARH